MGYALPRMIMPLMAHGRRQFGYFIPTNIALGLVVDGGFIGSRAGGGAIRRVSPNGT